jgi:hypothetical protein
METETEITSLERCLTALLLEKQGVLGGATVDSKALQRLETKEARIPVSLKSLRTRGALLADQVQEALKSEAQDRVSEIEKEQREIASRITARHAAFQ